MSNRRRTRSFALVLAMLVLGGTAGCGKAAPALAAHVDDLLRNGDVVAARQELASKLPALVREGKLSQVDELAEVLRVRLPELPATDASAIQRSSFSGYLDGISAQASELPWDDICAAAVRAVR